MWVLLDLLVKKRSKAYWLEDWKLNVLADFELKPTGDASHSVECDEDSHWMLVRHGLEGNTCTHPDPQIGAATFSGEYLKVVLDKCRSRFVSSQLADQRRMVR